MATLNESLPPEVLEYLAKLKGQLPPTSSAADPIAAKEAAQAAADAASSPGPVTGSPAADSAAAFEDAGMIPSKSAADSASAMQSAMDSAAPQGASGVEAGKELVPYNGGVPAAGESAAASAGEPAIAMGQGAGDQLPAVIGERGLVPAAEGAGPVMGDAITDALGSVGKVAGEAALPLAVAQAALSGPESATKSPMDGPVPGQPGKYFQGQDIVNGPDNREVMGPPAPDAKAATPVDQDDSDDADDSDGGSKASATPVAKATSKVEDSKSKLDPVLKQYLQDKQDLLDAQAKANQNQTIAGIARSVGQLSHSLARSRSPMDESAFKQLDETAQQPVTDVQNRQTAALKGLQTQQAMYQTQALASESDPNSDASKRTRAAYAPLLKMSGLDPSSVEGLSAADIKASMDKPIEFSAKLQELKDVAAMRRQQMTDSHDLKTQQLDEKESALIAGKLNAMTASSRSSLGLASKAKVQASRLKEILNDPNATNQDLNSAYADLNGIVSGAATIGGTAHQAYSNLQTKIADGLSFITSNPTAPNVPEVKKHVSDMADKMTGISDQVINNNTKSIQAGHTGWISRHPDLWQNQLDVQNASMGLGSQSGAAAAPGAAPSSALVPGVPASAQHPIGSTRLGKDGKTYTKTAQGWVAQ